MGPLGFERIGFFSGFYVQGGLTYGGPPLDSVLTTPDLVIHVAVANEGFYYWYMWSGGWLLLPTVGAVFVFYGRFRRCAGVKDEILLVPGIFLVRRVFLNDGVSSEHILTFVIEVWVTCAPGGVRLVVVLPVWVVVVVAVTVVFILVVPAPVLLAVRGLVLPAVSLVVVWFVPAVVRPSAVASPGCPVLTGVVILLRLAQKYLFVRLGFVIRLDA